MPGRYNTAGQVGVIGAAWLTAAGHKRWAGSPRGPEPAVA